LLFATNIRYFIVIACEIRLSFLLGYRVMKTHDNKPRPWTLTQRLGLILVGTMVMGWGVVTLVQGRLRYPNYWHAPVFAPFAVLVGGLAIFAAFKGRRS
jgi:hypothetical protein